MRLTVGKGVALFGAGFFFGCAVLMFLVVVVGVWLVDAVALFPI
jgi:hypothetical protein